MSTHHPVFGVGRLDAETRQYEKAMHILLLSEEKENAVFSKNATDRKGKSQPSLVYFLYSRPSDAGAC